MALTADPRRRARVHKVRTEWPHRDHEVYAALGVPRHDLENMRHAFEGEIVLPGMPDYEKASAGNPLYPAKPQIIAYCQVLNDVRLCLQWAHRFGWWVTCRSGGHSTAGYSVNSGMVIDVKLMNHVLVDRHRKRARIGAGAQFGPIDKTLDTFMLHTPGGGCPNVGVAGFMQGGGYGFTSREYGMNCDNVVRLTMMLADGRIVVAGPEQNSDLFWAVRGGTGGNFGVLLEIEYALHDLYKVWGVCLQWPIDQAVTVLQELQRAYMRSGASPKLGYQVVFATQEEGPALMFMGMYHGTRDEGLAAIRSLMQIGTPQTRVDRMGTYASLNSGLIDDNLPGIPGGGVPYEFKACGYVANTLSAADWQGIIDYFTTTPNPYNIVGLEPYGGQINAYPTAKSAFIHRDVAFDFFVDSFYEDNWPHNGRDKAKEWLDGYMRLARKHFNGHIYQNYPTPKTPNFRWAYWGHAFPALLRIKRKYDPKDFFHFEQSISPVPSEENPELAQRLTLDLDIDSAIVAEPY